MPKHKKSKTAGEKLSAKDLKKEVLSLFRREPKKQLNPKQVIQKLKLETNKDAVAHALNKLAEDQQLVALPDFRYQLNRAFAAEQASARRSGSGGGSGNVRVGVVDMTRTGAAYIVSEGKEADVYVPVKSMNTAMHGDRVEVRVWTPRGRSREEGEVVRVLERATEHFLGTLFLNPKYGIVSVEGKMPIDIMVDFKDLKEANEGDKVVVKITKWLSGRFQHPVGVVTTVLGAAGSHDIEMKAILINNGFNIEFPEEVIAESEALSEAIPAEEIARRRDMRGITTFTIDPDDAKDFDDALSIRYLENGDCEIGVHIADVSHYVKHGTALDKEAYLRSTSVYLVDRVLPMLPEKLSNGLCSLRPNEDKLTFSAIFIFDQNDKIKERWFGKTIIHSDRRFAYEEAQQIMDAGEGDFVEELKHLNKIAKRLRAVRFKKGAINFESEEVKFRLDEHGAPISMFVKERKEAHLLIEEFMLLANREVATFITKKAEGQLEIPFVYRIHDEPNMDKVEDLARFALELGFQMKINTPKEIANSYNRLAEAALADPALKMLEPIAIRTMAKAAYSSDNIGHYGLAFEYYSHFTSPIRRYSDVLAHRILEPNLAPDAFLRVKKDKLEEQCKHISKQERCAMEAERESVKYKQVEFMDKHIGEVFEGFVSGIGERGLYIELKESRAEGMVSFDTMSEPFEFSGGSRLRVRGLHTGNVIKMGDVVQVRVTGANLAKRQIDMQLT